MDIKQIRGEIDQIDEQLVALFKRRMDAALQVAQYKQQHGLPVLDRGREREVVSRAAELAGEGLERHVKALYTTLFDVSRNHQRNHLHRDSELRRMIERALETAPQSFPSRATIACQGIEGAYSQQAADRMFELPSILYFNSFDAVFSAVEKGMCRYGVLPIENSAAGSVTQVYDLMERHKFHIVRGIRQRIDHALLIRPGADASGIREIISHQQALTQCSEFLRRHPGYKATPVENTALAAKMVMESGRDGLAAIASGCCAELYGLTKLPTPVANTDNNYTRFIVIGKQLEVFPGSNKISITLSLPHQPGSLHGMLSRFASACVNLTKLESRPVAGSDFEFRFYFDIEASLNSPEVVQLLCDIDASSERFELLGNYLEGY